LRITRRLSALCSTPFPSWAGTRRAANTSRAASRTTGFYRDYPVTRVGKVWTFSGKTERATITFSDDDRTQTIAWEWKPAGTWLPLCDRVATRIDP
jgi:hypothetical protein